MDVLQSKINKNSKTFQANYEGNSILLKQLEAYKEESRFQGSESRIKRARNAYQLLASERIQLVLSLIHI